MLAEQELKVLQSKITGNSDQHAFAQLFVSSMPYLCQFANSIIKDKKLAEEIVSDVFTRIWQKRSTLAEVENFKLYLYISTKNTSLNYLSRHFRKETVSLDEMAINTTTSPYTPEQLLITSDVAKRIDEEIQKLPARCKIIFKLAKEDGLKYTDIANLLNISVKTIDSQIAIALKKISKAINFDLKKSHSSLH